MLGTEKFLFSTAYHVYKNRQLWFANLISEIIYSDAYLHLHIPSKFNNLGF